MTPSQVGPKPAPALCQVRAASDELLEQGEIHETGEKSHDTDAFPFVLVLTKPFRTKLLCKIGSNVVMVRDG